MGGTERRIERAQKGLDLWVKKEGRKAGGWGEQGDCSEQNMNVCVCVCEHGAHGCLSVPPSLH